MFFYNYFKLIIQIILLLLYLLFFFFYKLIFNCKAGIIRNIQDNQKNTNEIMNQAFKDLNNLMKKASEMVNLFHIKLYLKLIM